MTIEQSNGIRRFFCEIGKRNFYAPCGNTIKRRIRSQFPLPVGTLNIRRHYSLTIYPFSPDITPLFVKPQFESIA